MTFSHIIEPRHFIPEQIKAEITTLAVPNIKLNIRIIELITFPAPLGSSTPASPSPHRRSSQGIFSTPPLPSSNTIHKSSSLSGPGLSTNTGSGSMSNGSFSGGLATARATNGRELVNRTHGVYVVEFTKVQGVAEIFRVFYERLLRTPVIAEMVSRPIK